MKKTYSFYIKMSTRIQRLSFEMLHSEAESKNEEYRKEFLRKGDANVNYPYVTKWIDR
jgi:hypothetical protein